MKHKILIMALTALSLLLSGASHALLIMMPNGIQTEAQIVGNKLMLQDPKGNLKPASDGIYKTGDGKSLIVKGGIIAPQGGISGAIDNKAQGIPAPKQQVPLGAIPKQQAPFVPAPSMGDPAASRGGGAMDDNKPNKPNNLIVNPPPILKPLTSPAMPRVSPRGPAQTLPATNGGSRQAFSAPMWLRVNGELNAEVAAGGSVELSWNLPPDNQFSFVNLAATVRTERDGARPPEGPRCFLAHYCYDESLSPALGLTANGFAELPATAHRTFLRGGVPGAPVGSLRLNLASPAFPFRLVYAFRALYTNTALELKTSNEVLVTRRAEPPEPVAAPPGSEALPDLRIARLDYIRTGPDAGKITAIVAAEAGRTGRITGRVPYQMITPDLPRPILLDTGEVEITRLGVGAITSTYPVLGGGTNLVRIVVNGDRRITEASYDNNAAEAYLGEPDPTIIIPLRVHDVWKVEEGYTWVRLGVRFSGHALNSSSRLEAKFPDGNMIVCTSNANANFALGVAGPRSFVNRVASFLCVRTPTARLEGSLTTRSVLVFEGSGVDAALQWSFPVMKTWRWDYQVVDRAPELPDLDLQVLAVQIGPLTTGRLQGYSSAINTFSKWANAGPVAVKVTNIGQRASGPYEVSASIPSAFAGAVRSRMWGSSGWTGVESGLGLVPSASAYHCFRPDPRVIVLHQPWVTSIGSGSPTSDSSSWVRGEASARLRVNTIEFGRAQKAFTTGYPDPEDARPVTSRHTMTPEDEAAAARCTAGS